jgi:hypothetical protein
VNSYFGTAATTATLPLVRSGGRGARTDWRSDDGDARAQSRFHRDFASKDGEVFLLMKLNDKVSEHT